MKKQPFNSFKTPGQYLTYLLKEKGWSKRFLATILEIDESGVNRLTSDSRSFTAELAVILEEVFSVPASNFLDLQKEFDLAKAKYTHISDPNKVDRAHLLSSLPILEMEKRGWINIKPSKDSAQIELELKRFFKTSSLKEITTLSHSAKKTNAYDEPTLSQLSWLYRIKSIAESLIVPPYNPKKLKEAVTKDLPPLLASAEEARNVPKILNSCGVRFIVVEALKSSKIDGVCLWLDKCNPVIGMSMRFDRMDNFWFVLRHEIEHVLLNHGVDSPNLDIDLGGEYNRETTVSEEIAANEAAANFCIPKSKIDSFIARKAPIFPTRDFLGFSKLLGVHPSLVAGQIQHRTGRHELFRKYLVKIRAHVLQCAIVDGWGDVYPLDI